MATLKVPVLHEMEINFPVYFKWFNDFYKISSEKEYTKICIMNDCSIQMENKNHYDIMQAFLNGVQITEQEWKDALNKYRESVETFLNKNGVLTIDLLRPLTLSE